MIRMMILLPVNDTIKHIKAICEASGLFGISYNTSEGSELNKILIENFRVWEKSDKGAWKMQLSGEHDIGRISVLPARDNSILLLTAEAELYKIFYQFVEELKHHFRLLRLLADAEPWRNSPPAKMERDRIIWENRNLGETWERVAEKANCAVTTAKERYQDMLTAMESDSS